MNYLLPTVQKVNASDVTALLYVNLHRWMSPMGMFLPPEHK